LFAARPGVKKSIPLVPGVNPGLNFYLPDCESARTVRIIGAVQSLDTPPNPIHENCGAGRWRRCVLDPILAQIRQGITPEKVALTLAVGAMLGIFPVIGSSTILCAAAGILLGLNQPILQLVNYVVYPLQLALIIVFIRLGERLLGAQPVAISPNLLLERFHSAPLLFFKEFALTFLHGVAAWLIFAPVIGAILYLLIHPLLRAASTKRSGEECEGTLR
jgi:uncharacterized protein (DUF2062 family)